MCPKCASNNLRIKQATGLEFFVLLLISKRHYTCRDCDTVFRALDRRLARREDSEAAHIKLAR
jgi:hypothetical protein